ncbi:hypothetical protein ABTY53_15385 [Streptomyces noursei]|uniref:hypothetical protein n=1 Tax=Streptomyces noursei TaxID=1971 RepID=UPI003330C8D0
MNMSIVDQYRAIIDGDGLTYSPVRPAPVSGYMVSLAGSERTFPLESFSSGDFADYMSDYECRVMGEGLFYGAWVDGELVYLDLSVNVADRAEAEAMGRLESQLAIFDVVNGDVISL